MDRTRIILYYGGALMIGAGIAAAVSGLAPGYAVCFVGIAMVVDAVM